MCLVPTVLCLADRFLDPAGPFPPGAAASALLTALWLALFNHFLLVLPLRPAKVLALAIALGHGLHAFPLSERVPAEVAEEERAASLAKRTWELREVQEWQSGSARVLGLVSRARPPLLWLEGLTLDHRSLTIDGRAYDPDAVADFMESLDRVPGFSEPELDLYQSADGTYAFSLRLDAWTWRQPQVEGEPPPSPPRPTPQSEVPRLQAEVCALLARPDLPVQLCVAGTAAREREILPALVVRLESASYDDVVRLLTRLERLPRLVAVEELALTPDARDSRKLAADLVLAIPVAQRAAQARAAAALP